VCLFTFRILSFLIFLRLFCSLDYFCCIGFSFFSTMPRHWLERTSPQWPALCRVRRELLTESLVLFSRCWLRRVVELWRKWSWSSLTRRASTATDVSRLARRNISSWCALRYVSAFDCLQCLGDHLENSSPYLSVHCICCLSSPVCVDVGVLWWPNGWTDPDETRHGGRP